MIKGGNNMWSYNCTSYSNELYHHGVKGQKWGVRRYYNKDGTLTYAGRKRALKIQRDNEYDAHEEAHENRVTQIRGKHSDNMGFFEKRSYNKEIKRSYKDYENSMNESRKAYKEGLKEAKPLAYRDKLASKSKSKADRYSKSAEENRKAIDDLKKNGTESDPYKKWKAEKDWERATKYESDHSYTAPNGEKYSKSYRTSGQRFINDLFDAYDSKTTIDTLVDSYTTDRESDIALAKKYTKANSRLMNMPIDSTTTKKDIRKTYRGR